ncbi:MAG TPA: protein-disulfide reductase DsbD domain-containing protein [Candidatus Angelobacter sp.]|nr:protein-disulfide reductase DsbD domain-containing protein [Candidatus Angelobacter sp.]
MSKRANRSLVLLAVLFSQIAIADGVRVKHATVELLSREASAAPGSEVLLGLHFVLESGWHIYWVNPGDSGQPPAVNWELPAGFTAGEIQWPRPERMQSSPTLADYGYHGDVLLPVKLKVPSNATAGEIAKLAVEAKWLICREVCLPDRAQLKLVMPITPSSNVNPSTVQLFVRTERLLPRPMPKSWKVTAQARKEDFLLSINTGKRLARAEFFPLEPGEIDNAAQQKLQPTAWGARIAMKKSDLLLKPVSRLRGVLVLAGGQSYEFEAPVQTHAALK